MSQVIIQPLILVNRLKNILNVHGRMQNGTVYVTCCLLWLLPPPWPQLVCYEVVP